MCGSSSHARTSSRSEERSSRSVTMEGVAGTCIPQIGSEPRTYGDRRARPPTGEEHAGSLRAMDISCAFPPSLDAVEHTAIAEGLGYRRAWYYDSPALYSDVWMVLALAAERTRSIGLGPAVLVPSLRHPMVTAAAITTLAAQAPGRVAVAIGAGFTGRMVLGQRPMRWIEVATYIRVLRALLHGDDAEWDGQVLRMLQPDGFGTPRPLDVPILVGADGPKGMAVAAELADGVFSAMVPSPSEQHWRPLLAMGTVLDEGEDPTVRAGDHRGRAGAGRRLSRYLSPGGCRWGRCLARWSCMARGDRGGSCTRTPSGHPRRASRRGQPPRPTGCPGRCVPDPRL